MRSDSGWVEGSSWVKKDQGNLETQLHEKYTNMNTKLIGNRSCYQYAHVTSTIAISLFLYFYTT